MATAMTELIGVMRKKDKDKSGNIAFDCYPRMINLCCIKEDYDFAEEIAREALYVCELNNLTDKDMETLIIKDGLAKALYYLQKNEEAQIYAKSAYESRKKAFGDGAPYTIKPMFNYAVILNALDNQNPESKRLMENALKYSNDLYGPNHPKTIKIRDSYSAIFGEFRQERPQGKEKKFKVDLF